MLDTPDGDDNISSNQPYRCEFHPSFLQDLGQNGRSNLQDALRAPAARLRVCGGQSRQGLPHAGDSAVVQDSNVLQLIADTCRLALGHAQDAAAKKAEVSAHH